MPKKPLNILSFLAYGLLLYGVVFLWSQASFGTGYFISIFLVPVALGLFAQAVFDPKVEMRFVKIALYTTAITLGLFLVLFVIDIEAAICIVMGLPIILPLEVFGIYLARLYLTRNNQGPPNTLRASLIITESLPNQRLAWRFHFNEPESLASFDPHISPTSEMLTVSDGFYALTTEESDKTRLTLETHYQIRSPFNPYLRLWGALFLNDFHNSVLAVIKTRAEAAAS